MVQPKMKVRGDYIYWRERKGVIHKILKGGIQVERERKALQRISAEERTEPQKGAVDLFDGNALNPYN